MKVEARDEHRWLQRLIGTWTYEGDCDMGPDQPRWKSQGREQVRPLGEAWVVAEGEGEMPGGGAAGTMLTLGYDPQRKRFVGTWIGSMMTHLWVYEDGSLDEAGKVLTLSAEGPSMAGDGGMASYQDLVELVSDDHRVLRSRVRHDDGTWHEFMRADYRRAE